MEIYKKYIFTAENFLHLQKKPEKTDWEWKILQICYSGVIHVRCEKKIQECRENAHAKNNQVIRLISNDNPSHEAIKQVERIIEYQCNIAKAFLYHMLGRYHKKIDNNKKGVDYNKSVDYHRKAEFFGNNMSLMELYSLEGKIGDLEEACNSHMILAIAKKTTIKKNYQDFIGLLKLWPSNVDVMIHCVESFLLNKKYKWAHLLLSCFVDPVANFKNIGSPYDTTEMIQPNGDAMCYSSLMYYYGLYVDKNLEKAKNLLEQATMLKSPLVADYEKIKTWLGNNL